MTNPTFTPQTITGFTLHQPLARGLWLFLLAMLIHFSSANPIAATPLPTVAVYSSAKESAWNVEVVVKLTATGYFQQIDNLSPLACSLDLTPTLATLNQYSAVLVYSDCEFNDSVALGNVLADYIDEGGIVVVSFFALYADSFYGIGGRFKTGGYLPVTPGGLSTPSELFLVADLPNDPLLDGVGSFDGGSSSYHNTLLSLTPGATLIAHWTDEEPLVVRKGNVVALNFYPPSSDSREDFWNVETDGTRLIANALRFVPDVNVDENQPPVAACKNVTVPAGANCTASASIDDGSFDPDAGDTITLSQEPSEPYTLGQTTVILTVTDNHGRSSTCSATVTVEDTVPPTITTCLPAVSVPFGGVPAAATTVAEFLSQGGALSDTCGLALAVTSSDSVAGICPTLVTRTYTIKDISGNTATCEQIITENNLFAEDAILWQQPLARQDTGGAIKFRFKLGRTIPIKIQAHGCNSDVTENTNVIGKVAVFADNDLNGVADAGELPIASHGLGEPGGIMDKHDGQLRYNLDTTKLPQAIPCFLLQVTVTDISTGEFRSEMIPLQAR